MSTERIHLLSKKSASSKHDVFIFRNDSPSTLLLAFNNRLARVSPADIHRWSTISTPYGAVASDDFAISPVNVAHYDVLAYAIERSGPFFDKCSSEPLPPGDYGWYWLDNEYSLRLPQLIATSSPLETTLGDLSKHSVRGMDMYSDKRDRIPSDIEKAVLERDSGRCVLSKSREDVILKWIYRPGAAHVYGVLHPTMEDEYEWEHFVTSQNIVCMNRTLADLFEHNKFAVDTLNDRRIVIFREIEPNVAALLPSHFPPNIVDDEFLRKHFRYTLRHCSMDCDINIDYPPQKISYTMDLLDYGDEDEQVPFSDERWQTPLGADIMRQMLSERIISSRHDDDGCEGEGNE